MCYLRVLYVNVHSAEWINPLHWAPCVRVHALCPPLPPPLQTPEGGALAAWFLPDPQPLAQRLTPRTCTLCMPKAWFLRNISDKISAPSMVAPQHHVRG